MIFLLEDGRWNRSTRKEEGRIEKFIDMAVLAYPVANPFVP